MHAVHAASNSFAKRQMSLDEPDTQDGSVWTVPVKHFDCVLILVVAVLIGCCGTGYGLDWLQKRRRSELLLSHDTHRTEATITDQRHYTTGDEHNVHHYLASYTFEAVRSDGMRCLMTVEQQRQPQNLWQKAMEEYRIGGREQTGVFQVGSKVQVIYLRSDPRHCRLDAANEVDFETTHGSLCVGVFTACLVVFLIFMVVFDLAVSSCFFTNVENGRLLAALLLGALSVLCTFSFCGHLLPGSGPTDVTEQELGFQTKAKHLDDISGIWVIQSALGTLEYEFVMSSETTVKARGRRQGSEAWDPACDGRFVGKEGTELIWDDFQHAHIRAKFDGRGGLAGSISTDAGKKVDFTGSRPS